MILFELYFYSAVAAFPVAAFPVAAFPAADFPAGRVCPDDVRPDGVRPDCGRLESAGPDHLCAEGVPGDRAPAVRPVEEDVLGGDSVRRERYVPGPFELA